MQQTTQQDYYGRQCGTLIYTVTALVPTLK